MRDVARHKLWLLPGAVLVLALAAWVVVFQGRGGGLRVDQTVVPPPASSTPTSPAAGAPEVGAAPGTSAGVGTQAGTADTCAQAGDPGTDSLGELLEAQAGQLTDVLAHLRSVCAAAGGGSDIAVGTVERCVEDAEAAVGTVELIRGSVASPAGAAMPAEVRTRWDATLRDATGSVREALGPLWDKIGRALASGRAAPADARALGHLRDRIGRVLSEADRP